MTPTPILQFGTSRFLQAHADLFISEALAQGHALGPVTVVQSTGDAGRSHRLRALSAPGGYPVRVRGLLDGQPVDHSQQVTSISRTLSTVTDWPEVVRVAVQEARIILSNTSDSGFAPMPADAADTFDQAMSYPAKLTRLLHARFAAGGAPVQIMPTELIVDNGQVLKIRVLELAKGAAFRAWLETDVAWVNSLVDRIVSEPLEPAGAVAEPYALWAIQDQPGLILPCTHPSIQVVKSLEQAEALKLFILNLGHTVMAQDWLDRGSAAPGLVREVMADPLRRADLMALYEGELIPGFAAAGLEAKVRDYIGVTLGRFSNPFLDHKLSDIAQNHSQKISRRIGGFLTWAASHGHFGPSPRLRRILALA